MWGAVFALWAVVLVGCTGGGGEVAGGAPVSTAPQSQEVVVRFDRNGDDEPDLVTLDATDENLKIVSALDGSAAGDPVDVTPVLQGTELDPEIVRSLKTYLANSLDVASETQLDVVDRNGNTVTITIYE
jgi:hypothetical protein